jgi:hypothetical protein
MADQRALLRGPDGPGFSGISHYQMGINGNRQHDEVMSHYWGPSEVVDGSQYRASQAA